MLEIICNSLESNKKILTIHELAHYTNLKLSYIYKLTSLGKIPYYKGPGGKMLYFKRAEIDEWLLSSHGKTKKEIIQEIGNKGNRDY